MGTSFWVTVPATTGTGPIRPPPPRPLVGATDFLLFAEYCLNQSPPITTTIIAKAIPSSLPNPLFGRTGFGHSGGFEEIGLVSGRCPWGVSIFAMFGIVKR